MLATLALPAPALAQSDLQGIWTNGTLTPFERPPALGTKAFYTPEEAAVEERQATERRNSRTRRPGDVGSDNEAFVDSGYKLVSTRQTSLVVDPPDGRIPIRPEAEKQRDFNVNSLDSFETMSPWDRCITRSPTQPVPGRLQQRVSDRPDADLRHDHVGDDSRGADHPARRTAARQRARSASGLATPEAAGRARRWSSTRPISATAAGLRPTPAPAACAASRTRKRCTSSNA